MLTLHIAAAPRQMPCLIQIMQVAYIGSHDVTHLRCANSGTYLCSGFVLVIWEGLGIYVERREERRLNVGNMLTR